MLTYTWQFHFFNSNVSIEQLGITLQNDQMAIELFVVDVHFAISIAKRKNPK